MTVRALVVGQMTVLGLSAGKKTPPEAPLDPVMKPLRLMPRA
ncbi:MAG TPA: hypothetical protein VGQ02_10290 [Candidatus Limnocylindrales bacterium]|nr:hypothetical protein [Candidatus Limnocylindrales bacterium]